MPIRLGDLKIKIKKFYTLGIIHKIKNKNQYLH